MNVQKRELVSFLEQNKIWAKRSMGQNFLVDQGVLKKIIKAANLKSTDTVIEIGPGLGVLTAELAKGAGKVLAIEKDDKFAASLKVLFLNSNVKIFHQDVLNFDFAKIADYKVVANIPYNITSLIIRKFLEKTNKPQLMVLLVQKEVAERIVAKKGEMSLLSVSVQFYSEPKIIDIVKNDCFYPQPKVDSAIIQFKIKQNLPDVNEREFFRLVKFGFAARRKTLENNLAAGMHIEKKSVADIIKKTGLDSKVRAEDLDIENWLDLYKIIKEGNEQRKREN